MTTALPTSLEISLFDLLRGEFGDTLEPLRCTKATLVHLSHTLEDLVLSQRIPAILFTGFQESSHWREETERYRALAEVAQQVCIFAGGDLPPESSARQLHITLRGRDPLRQEWFLALLCPQFAVLLCGQDRQIQAEEEALRQFDTLWSFDPRIVDRVLDLLEQVIASYRPERSDQIRALRRDYPPVQPDPRITTMFTAEMVRFEEQLQQALHAATRALDAQLRWRDDLTAALVHDLRSPLQGLMLALEMLQSTQQFDGATTQHMLKIAHRNSGHLRDLVQIILDTNQLEAGQLRLEWQMIPAAVFIADALAPIQMLAESSDITLHVDIDAQVTLLWGDMSLLRRVLQNLVSNALKFTPAGGQVEIGLAPAPSPDRIELRVRDTGKGIAPSALSRIFERYYQVGGDGKIGNGLGLYFCRLAVEAHSGTIRAASQIGMGTTMTVVLPSLPPRAALL